MDRLRRAGLPGGPGQELILPSDPASARCARAFARQAVEAWGLAELAEDAALVVDELVANAASAAARAGQPAIAVLVARTPSGALIAAGDQSPQEPVPSGGTSVWAEHGRGLDIIIAVCGRHGWCRRGPWKIVWGELTAAAAAPAGRPAAGAECLRRKAA